MFDVANAWIQGFLNSVGAAVFVPVIMIIMGLVVKMKVRIVARCSIYRNVNAHLLHVRYYPTGWTSNVRACWY